MAYNPYFPATYQPQYMQYQPQQQSTGVLWVSGMQEALAYPVAPNNAVALWDSSCPAIYLKQADASGKPSIKTYDLVERKETAPAASSAPAPDYATKDDVKALAKALAALKKKVEGEEK